MVEEIFGYTILGPWDVCRRNFLYSTKITENLIVMDASSPSMMLQKLLMMVCILFVKKWSPNWRMLPLYMLICTPLSMIYLQILPHMVSDKSQFVYPWPKFSSFFLSCTVYWYVYIIYTTLCGAISAGNKNGSQGRMVFVVLYLQVLGFLFPQVRACSADFAGTIFGLWEEKTICIGKKRRKVRQ